METKNGMLAASKSLADVMAVLPAAGPQWQSLDMLSMEAPSAKDPASASTSNRSSASSFSNQLSCPSCDSAMVNRASEL
jgi:hypothetical protein